MNTKKIMEYYEMHKSANVYPGGKAGNPNSMLTHQAGPSLPGNLVNQQAVSPQLNTPPTAAQLAQNPQSLVRTPQIYADPNQSRLGFGFNAQNPAPANDAASRIASMNMPSATMSNPLGYFHNR